MSSFCCASVAQTLSLRPPLDLKNQSDIIKVYDNSENKSNKIMWIVTKEIKS